MKLSVHLVAWNGAKYIPYLFESLRNQTLKDWGLLILDNGSTDDTVELIKKEMNNLGVQAQLMENQENLGFAAGHNQLFKCYMLHVTCYMLLLNQDMYLMPDCLEKLVKFMDEHPEAAAVSPRLMRWDFNRLQAAGYRLQDSFTDQIDSLGLKVFRNRRVVEWMAGQKWPINVPSLRSLPAGKAGREAPEGQGGLASHTTPYPLLLKEGSVEVFGVSGALPMFRKAVIEKVGLFDDSFGSYKEDVDLAFRLRSAGYRSFVVLDAVAYHDRSAAGVEKTGDLAVIENKKKQSKLIKYNSYKNHLMTLIKNEYWQNYLLDLPWIKWYELKKFVYFLLFDRGVLRGLGEIWRLRRQLRDKRYEIRDKRRVGWREMREWWK